MVCSAVGSNPAFMVASAGSIPAFPTCPYFRTGSALERKCYPLGLYALYSTHELTANTNILVYDFHLISMAQLVAVIILVEFATFKTTFNMPWDRFYESVEDKTILSIESCWMKAFQERFQRLKCRMHRIHWRRLSSLLQLAAITVVYGSIRSCCLFRFLNLSYCMS